MALALHSYLTANYVELIGLELSTVSTELSYGDIF